MSTITKKDLIERVAKDTDLSRPVVKHAVQAMLDRIVRELAAGNRIELRDFGVFEVRARAARRAQNPKTLRPVEVPARRTVKFKVGRLMKASMDATPGEQEGSPAGEATGAHNGHAAGAARQPGREAVADGAASAGRGTIRA